MSMEIHCGVWRREIVKTIYLSLSAAFMDENFHFETYTPNP